MTDLPVSSPGVDSTSVPARRVAICPNVSPAAPTATEPPTRRNSRRVPAESRSKNVSMAKSPAGSEGRRAASCR